MTRAGRAPAPSAAPCGRAGESINGFARDGQTGAPDHLFRRAIIAALLCPPPGPCLTSSPNPASSASTPTASRFVRWTASTPAPTSW
ncbi:hypothetical protein RSPO_m01115 (plasmid) [Ralstonia solanacearum Po82]|uniref:Uncharacterized protein n=1 Tax=Ralstonia solanacearum (strain Po82) TaxID=1031711 RepID=F6G9G3_RALS8|nr:hypothetical protein RSPO_m01115 [Ralstonia solanacearum Po82]